MIKEILLSFVLGVAGLFGITQSNIPIENPISEKPLVVVAAADTTCNFPPEDNSECQDNKVALLAEKETPKYVLIPGDIQYGGGTLSDYNKYFSKTWGKFANKLKPVAGNHEYETPNAAGYFSYFNNIPAFYSFDDGNWHFIAIDSNCWAVGGCNETSPQYEWLKEDLQENSKPCVLAYWHHPRFSSGYHGANINMDPIWNLLEENSAEIVLNGHDHHYERFTPKENLREFIVGTGGRSLYPAPFAEDGSEFRSSIDFGFLKLELSKNSYKWAFHTLDHGVTDKGEGKCAS